jgi:hypothetical protein
MAKGIAVDTNKRDYKPKGTSIGNGHFKRSSLNKRKKSNYKKYRGQGK